MPTTAVWAPSAKKKLDPNTDNGRMGRNKIRAKATKETRETKETKQTKDADNGHIEGADNGRIAFLDSGASSGAAHHTPWMWYPGMECENTLLSTTFVAGDLKINIFKATSL